MRKYQDGRLGRREMLCGVAVAASAAVLTRGHADATPPPADVSPDPQQHADAALAHGLQPACEEVRAYFGPLREGTVLEGRWTLEAVHAVRTGAIPLVLSRDGKRFAVELLSRTPGGPSPVAHTAIVSVFLSNRGDGALMSDESDGLGAMALGRALERRERAGARPPRLLTHDERRVRHPLGIFHIPVGR